jgi:hypothetical protein
VESISLCVIRDTPFSMVALGLTDLVIMVLEECHTVPACPLEDPSMTLHLDGPPNPTHEGAERAVGICGKVEFT